MSHDEVDMERVLTINAVAEALSISRATVYRMIRRTELRPVLVNGRKRIPRAQVEALMAPKEEMPDGEADG
jgi:excisionase family DNA binding protein